MIAFMTAFYYYLYYHVEGGFKIFTIHVIVLLSPVRSRNLQLSFIFQISLYSTPLLYSMSLLRQECHRWVWSFKSVYLSDLRISSRLLCDWNWEEYSSSAGTIDQFVKKHTRYKDLNCTVVWGRLLQPVLSLVRKEVVLILIKPPKDVDKDNNSFPMCSYVCNKALGKNARFFNRSYNSMWRVIWIVCTRNEVVELIPLRNWEMKSVRKQNQSPIILCSRGL